MQNRRAERLRIAAEVDVPQRDVEQESGDAPHLPAARGKKPPSLWDWKTWTMAKPRLWRYGDAGNLCERNTDLSTSERAACLLLREELAYTVHGEHDDGKEVVRPGMGSPPVQNLSEAVQPGMGSRPLQKSVRGSATRNGQPADAKSLFRRLDCIAHDGHCVSSH